MCDYLQGAFRFFPEGLFRSGRLRTGIFLCLLLVDSVLTDFVEQNFVAYVEHARRLFSTPDGFFERARNGFLLGFVLQTSHQ